MELPIESKKYGKFVVLYDECDEEIVKGKGYNWYIKKDNGTFYVVTNITLENGKRKKLKMHRLLTGAPAGMLVDHINHCGWDNRHSNLRICSNKENSQNRLKKLNTSSQYKGVHWHKPLNKWRAMIRIDGRLKHISYFTDEVAAARAYDESALIHHGPYALLNFPKPIVVNTTNIININN